PRPNHSGGAGLAGSRRLAPARGGSPRTARRSPHRPGDPRDVDTDGTVRGDARVLAAHQRRRGALQLMRAIVYREYGSPDVLRREEVGQTTPGGHEVLGKTW